MALSLSAALCGYRFLAGHDYPGVTAWRVAAGWFGVLFMLAGILAVYRKRQP